MHNRLIYYILWLLNLELDMVLQSSKVILDGTDLNYIHSCFLMPFFYQGGSIELISTLTADSLVRDISPNRTADIDLVLSSVFP